MFLVVFVGVQQGCGQPFLELYINNFGSRLFGRFFLLAIVGRGEVLPYFVARNYVKRP